METIPHVTLADAAEQLGIPVSTARHWIDKHDLPKHIRPQGRARVCYLPAETVDALRRREADRGKREEIIPAPAGQAAIATLCPITPIRPVRKRARRRLVRLQPLVRIASRLAARLVYLIIWIHTSRAIADALLDRR